MKTLQLILAIGGVFLGALESTAQTSVTVPVGAIKITLPAGPSTSMVCIPIKATSVLNLRVASFTANALTFDGTPIGASNLAAPAAPFFVIFVTGQHAGRALLVTANTTNTVTLSTTDGTSSSLALDTASFSVAIGDRVEIVPGDTLATLFGTGGTLKLVGGTNALNADTVGFWNGARFIGYFYNNTLGYWVSQDSTSTNANNLVLYPEVGLSLTRKAGRPALTLTFVGKVPNHRSGIRHNGNGVRILAHPLPVSVPLSYFAFDLQGGMATGSILAADTIGLWNGARWVGYYKNAGGQWLTQGNASDQSALQIQPGQAVSIQRRSAKLNGASILGENPPYSL